jgi:hypothetical protein
MCLGPLFTPDELLEVRIIRKANIACCKQKEKGSYARVTKQVLDKVTDKPD